MEQHAGVPLLVRGRRGVAPTPAGTALARHARDVLAEVARLDGAVAGYLRTPAAPVTLLAGSSALHRLVPRALTSFLREHPDRDVTVLQSRSAETVRMLVDGRADLGVVIEDETRRLRPGDRAARGRLAGRDRSAGRDPGRPDRDALRRGGRAPDGRAGRRLAAAALDRRQPRPARAAGPLPHPGRSPRLGGRPGRRRGGPGRGAAPRGRTGSGRAPPRSSSARCRSPGRAGSWRCASARPCRSRRRPCSRWPSTSAARLSQPIG